jgi:hypothetical protein
MTATFFVSKPPFNVERKFLESPLHFDRAHKIRHQRGDGRQADSAAVEIL